MVAYKNFQGHRSTSARKAAERTFAFFLLVLLSHAI